MEKFETATHTKDSERMLEQINKETQSTSSFEGLSELKTQFRFLRKNLSAFLRTKLQKDFKQVLIVTVSNVPKDYILAFKKQYPDKEIKVLLPVHDISNLEKTNINCEFFLQNKINEAKIYKFPKTSDNIEIFGIYSTAFSTQDITKFQYLAPFMKAVRVCAKKIKPDIIHSDRIPFFLGAEFESKMPYSIRVLQVIDDFIKFERDNIEPFWAAINLLNKNGMRKLCNDKIIKKCIASLFNLHNVEHFTQMRDCLEFIYQNYSKFRENINRDEEIEENILFRRMNTRVLQLFPEMKYEDEAFYNPIYFTIKKTDFWAVISKSYYDTLFRNIELCGKISKRLANTKQKSGKVSVCTNECKAKIYQSFNSNNFRELRSKNKTYLLKEFSENRIRTRFVDISLFKNDNYTINGYLDSFYDAPLIFAKFSTEIFNEGVDIAFNTILKLFELRKNIQVIINIEGGLANDFIKSYIEFLENNSALNGRWIFIDGKIKLEQFYAASDIILVPKRTNSLDVAHIDAMKYGCIPIATRFGIYNDTIVDIFDDMISGCGFKTKSSLLLKGNVSEIFTEELIKVLNLYNNNPSSWNLLVKNAINAETGWNFEVIENYNKIYELL